MDYEVTQWLRKNDLLHLKQTFESQKIRTMRSLRNLTDEMLKELIPEVGLRADLSEPLAALKANLQDSVSLVLSEPIQSSCDLDFDCNQLVDDNGNELQVLTVETPRVKRRKVNVPRHILAYQSLQSLQSLDLRAALLEDIVTSNAILVAEQTGGLAEPDRAHIVALAVRHLLRHNNKPGADEYMCLANKICEVFPFECAETYYVPGEPGKNATGKLPNKVKNLKYWLGRNGDKSLSTVVIVPKTKEAVSAPVELDGCSDLEDETVQTSIVLLKHHSLDSVPDLLRHWSVTHASRRKHQEELQELHGVLKSPNGHLLICQDFQELFPGRENSLLSLWESHRGPLISLLKREVPKDELLKRLESSEVGNQDGLILSLLPTLCCRRGRGTSAAAVPIPIVRRAFFLHVKIAGDLNRELAAHQRTLQQRKLKFQPLILAVGPSLEQVHSWYVQVEDARYHLRTAVAALDVCFKAFFSLNIEYPSDAYPLWLFVQKYFFNMHMDGDTAVPRITSLISSLKGLMSKAA